MEIPDYRPASCQMVQAALKSDDKLRSSVASKGVGKADLRRMLPALLEDAGRSKQAAALALEACCSLGLQPPAELLRSGVIAALPLDDAVRLLARLSVRAVETDASSALTAIRESLLSSEGASSSSRNLNSLSMRVSKKLLELSGNRGEKSKRQKVGITGYEPKVRFTPATVKAAAALAAWLVRTAAQSMSRQEKSKEVYRAALRWAQTLHALAPRGSDLEAVSEVLGFWRTLGAALPASIVFRLSREPSLVSLLEDAQSTVIEAIEPAMVQGRLDELARLLAVAETDKDLRGPVLARMREVGRRRSMELPAGAAEWLASVIHEDPDRVPILRAADESQSSVIESASMCLLSAWDSVQEPRRAQETLTTLLGLVHDVFKLDLLGRVGEIVKIDSRHHQIVGDATSLPDRVRIVRPGVVWSDGFRSRAIVRALVERIP
jgi:hypothetical protein